MKNFIRVEIIIFCIVFFGVFNCFAHWNNQMRSLGNPEFSKLSKDQDGLMSCTDMQTYQPPFTKMALGYMDRMWMNLFSKLNLTYYNFTH